MDKFFMQELDEFLGDMVLDLIYSNQDFWCSDCIVTIQKLIFFMDECGFETEELKNTYNDVISNIY